MPASAAVAASVIPESKTDHLHTGAFVKIRLAHLWNVGTALLVLGLLCAAAATYMLTAVNNETNTRQRAETAAQLLSAQLTTQLAPYRNAAQKLAQRTAEQHLLTGKKLVERASILDAKGSALPRVLKVRLVPAGTSKRDSALPEMTYVCLDLLERSERGEDVPKLELHLPETPSEHIDVFAPIIDSTNPKQIAGHVLLNIDPSVVTSVLAGMPAETGYAELHQPTPQGQALVLASGGDPTLKISTPAIQHPFPDTGWTIAIWPARRVNTAKAHNTGLWVAMAVLAVTLLVLSLAIPRQMIMSAFQNDSEVMTAMFNDIRNGVLMEQYPFRLDEFRQLANPLRTSGEAMLEHLRSLEKQTQTDVLTGAATLPYFTSRLKRLFQQAQTGFTSALLLADIDQFKEIVAQQGPTGSDRLLKHFAGQLLEAVRQSDVVARLEGGRFAVLFPMADLKKIEPIVQRLRTHLDLAFNSGKSAPTPFTWSAGLTVIAATDTRPQDSLARANAALQTARQEGGNMTITQPPEA
jgi:diguanylate cyclase (GGDEF)-like protein